MQSESVIRVENLSVTYNSRTGPINALKDISWQINRGEAIGICGESGSGKTAAALAIIRLLPSSAVKTDGRIFLENTNLLQLSDKEMRSIHGKRIAMIFQETMTSMNPALTIGRQICEPLVIHRNCNYRKARQKAIRLLESVGMPSPEAYLDKYPHQLSGGMLQRAMIAMAISCEPDVLIADEPMSALDSNLQQQIKNIFKELKTKHKMALIMISHDMRSVSDICDKTVIMYDGAVVEAGPSSQLAEMPGHPYTEALLNCIPKTENSGKPLKTIKGSLTGSEKDLPGCVFASRCEKCMIICKEDNPPFFELGDGHKSACWLHTSEPDYLNKKRREKKNKNYSNISVERSTDENLTTVGSDEQLLSVENLSVSFNTGLSGNDKNAVRAVKDVSFSINRGETFGLIGESGCGKTTLARTIMGIYPPEKGKIFYQGSDLSKAGEKNCRQKIQYIFQDPYGSLNPRMTVKDIISEALDISNLLSEKQDRIEFLRNVLNMTGLTEDSLFRYPHEFSGGQRQRIAIARSLTANPEFIICDEPVSSLDVSVQAQILNLLTELQSSLKLTYLFISHDLTVVRHVSDRIGVMYRGQLIESCSTKEMFSRPLHPYTRDLFASSADISVRKVVSVQSSKNKVKSVIEEKYNFDIHPLRCGYSALCSRCSQSCLAKKPEMREILPGHLVSCHLANEM